MNDDAQGKVCPGHDTGFWESVAETKNCGEMGERDSPLRAGDKCSSCCAPCESSRGPCVERHTKTIECIQKVARTGSGS